MRRLVAAAGAIPSVAVDTNAIKFSRWLEDDRVLAAGNPHSPPVQFRTASVRSKFKLAFGRVSEP
jgi:hypothetical protein